MSTLAAAAAPPAPHAATRSAELDTLRGLMLVLMTLTHLPTQFALPLTQPFGYVSAAEGFVLISAFLAGRVYTARHEREGAEQMRNAFLKRVAKIYVWQALLLAFLFTVIALLGSWRQQPAVANLLVFYWEQPLRAFASGLLLVYNPPLLDILPMYIVFMLISPLLLLHGVRQGWAPVLAASIVLWLAAQFGAGAALYEWAATHAKLKLPPVQQTGSFAPLAWQLLWVLGLWMGSTRVVTAPDEERAVPRRFPAWIVWIAAAVAVACLVWRHAVGHAPFGPHADLNALFDKWHLGPLRMLNLFALMVLLIRFAPWLRRHVPPLPALALLGQASLAVFVAHLVIALLLLAWLGEPTPARAWALDVAVLAGSFAVLYAVAWSTRELDRRSAAARQRLRARCAALVTAGARRSRGATGRSPPR